MRSRFQSYNMPNIRKLSMLGPGAFFINKHESALPILAFVTDK